jgi:hypothetical protein
LSASLYEKPRVKISQGDIIEGVSHFYLTSITQSGVASPEPRVVSARGIILTHDCHIDKPKVLRWSISPVVPLHKLPKGEQGDTMRNRRFSRLFLPKYDALTEDSFVDFDQVSSISRDLIMPAKRILSLSDVGRHALYAQYIRFLTRWELRSIVCPSCGAEIDVSQGLSVRIE